jgi:hypothetical protein
VLEGYDGMWYGAHFVIVKENKALILAGYHPKAIKNSPENWEASSAFGKRLLASLH